MDSFKTLLKFFLLFAYGLAVGFVLLLVLSNISYASSEYLTQAQVNEFIEAYNSFFGVEIPKTLDIKNVKSFSMGISQDTISNKTEYYLFLYDGTSAITTGGGSSRAYIKEKDGSKTFYRYTYYNGSWDSGSSVNSVEFTDAKLMILDTLPVVETSNIIFYKFSLSTGAITKQIGEIQNQITVINNNVYNLTERVSNIEEETGGVSEKLDTVIDNQQTINDNITSTGNAIGGKIDNLNNDFNNFADSNTSGLDNSGTSAITNTDKFQVDDPTENVINAVFDGVTNVLLNDSVEEITVNVMDNQYKIKSNFFVIPDSPLKVMLIAYWSFQIVYIIYKDIRKHIEMAKTLDFFDKCNKDIKADML